ncbi:Isocitrate dehydrogenase (NAD(+)) [Chthoniobacter flavus Ellin428]|uniref:Isocitrate dehydrogenase (NAD(+)) n=1 Tax=Chthoniobacter flavus Ellin428 TaxID=497964 RepID=B4D4B9_9BACT|nr:Isocitrate dehydrogenase (NAD(+)) [Chthoniobacter flavus Ellin428]TCO89040.1 isocitrate dehydrogenase (NAD+) [Chthoniobacter flavus]
MKPHFIVTLVPGDGIGPEIASALVKVFQAASVPITWDPYNSPTDDRSTLKAIVESARKHRLMIKGPLATPIAEGPRSINVTLRSALGLYANVRPCKSFAGVESRWDGVELLIVRENTEGAYTGIEHDRGQGKVEAVKIVTAAASMRIAEYAFRAASHRPRRTLAVAHKANIMKKADGLFLQCCREVARKYPAVSYREILVDNCCLQLVLDPQQFDVLLFQNLYGDIVSDLCAGLIGGLGLAPSANIGAECAMFEAVHGSAPDIAGQGIANPAALILSGVLLLRHVNLHREANRIEQAVRSVIGHREATTGDLGGNGTTTSFTNAVIEALHEPAKESLLPSLAVSESPW